MPLLLLDLDDTLTDRRTAFRDWATAFSTQHSLGDVVDWLEELDACGYTPRPALFAALAERFPLPDSVEEMTRRYAAEFPGFTPPPTERSRALLQQLREAGWRIAVVTNGSPAQAQKLEAAGIGHLVDACCISTVEGVRKPEAAIFERAAERCGASLAGAWMVGDNPEADIGGAHRLGLRTIWLRHGRSWTESDYKPSAVVDSLDEALDYLVALRRTPDEAGAAR